MMGGLLETFCSHVSQRTNRALVFKAVSAPKDRLGKTLQLQEWTLRHYIDVGHELGWISTSAKDIGEVVIATTYTAKQIVVDTDDLVGRLQASNPAIKLRWPY
jgi:hypothetical protein